MPDESAPLRALASTTLEKRMLRSRHFDRQVFGGQRWDLMLALFSQQNGSANVSDCARLIDTPPATTLALARILSGHGMIELGDSHGGWHEIPVTLSAPARDQLASYLSAMAAVD